MPNINKKWFYAFAIAGLALVYIAGMFIDLMDIDATQYGSMSLEMLRNGHWLQVKDHLHDYLDKPPLLFWLSALSFKVFGVANWSYKLPSLLFSVLGFYSTYRFARLYYSEQVAGLSALLLASCQAYLLFNNDVRTDALLTGSVIFTVWQLAEYLNNEKWWNLIGTGVGVSLALLAKGPIGLMVPMLGFVADWVCKRQWRNFFRPAWLVVVLIVAMLSPMLYGLFQQHGWHGWYFFFWAQSFGRLTGQNTFVNSQAAPDHDPLFFVHTFLWSFLPWSFLFAIGLWKDFVALFKARLSIPRTSEVVTLAGFTLAFIGLSMSGYKLPYYIYVVFPFAAIISAKGLDGIILQPALSKTMQVTGIVTGMVMLAAGWALCAYVFPLEKGWLYILPTLFTLLYLLSLRRPKASERILFPALMGFIAVNIAVNLQGYPSLLKYQSTSQVGKIVTANHIPEGRFRYYRVSSPGLDFYSQRLVPEMFIPTDLAVSARTHDWVYTDHEGLMEAQSQQLSIASVDSFPHFRVTKLSLGFLNPNERNKHTDMRYLIKF